MSTEAKNVILPATESMAATSGTQPATPRHLVVPPGQSWGLWRWACLRGAGFPAHLVSQLAAPVSAGAADRLLAFEKEAEDKRRRILEYVRRGLDEDIENEYRKRLQRAKKQLDKCKVPDSLEAVPESEREEALAAAAREEEARAEFQKQFELELAGISERIMEIANDNRFRQAVLLQNRDALRCVLQSFSGPASNQKKRSSKDRQREELIASYLQRYCLKNDSIGFFGPIGWARIAPEVDSITVRPGPNLVSKSEIYFEHWGIEALARKIAADRAVKPWIAPRLLPTFYLEGSTLHAGAGHQFPLPAVVAAILSRCDGERTARQIALEYGRILRIKEEEVYKILEDLAAQKVISWTFELPFELYPERSLRHLLERIEKPELRNPAMAMLGELQEARERVRLAGESADQLDESLRDLDEIFVRLTGEATNRSAGQMYAARTLVYQDCQRDMELEIGSQILSSLALPLSLLTTSTRWLTYQGAKLCQDSFQRIYDDLRHKTRKSAVDFLQFWTAAESLILPEQPIMERIVPEFQALWSEILQAPEGQPIVQRSGEELRHRVEAAFHVPRAGWQRARYHSPDLMIGADSIESIQRGDYFFVLGELHIAAITVRTSAMMSQHPCPEQMIEMVDSDLQHPLVWPVFLPMIVRSSMALASSKDYYLLIDASPRHTVPLKILRASELVVDSSPSGMVVRTRDGRLRFELLEFFGGVLSSQAIQCMRKVVSGPHTPRVMIDKLVLCREAWSFPASDIPFAGIEQEGERYVAARRWMREHQLPRFVFVSAHVEKKPFFLDFETPIYVDIFSKIVRRVLASDQPQASINVSEMLPAPDQLWLPDAQGQKYTSEFRMVMFDLKE